MEKCGIKETDSTVATAVRTIVVLAFSWFMVFLIGSQNQISAISGKTLLFLVLSGLATGLSILITIAFSYMVFHEKLTKKVELGCSLSQLEH